MPTLQKSEAMSSSSSVVAELQKEGRSEAVGGYEQNSWKARRQREIKKDVEEGKGFGDMITDQIWEVWNQGKKKENDDGET